MGIINNIINSFSSKRCEVKECNNKLDQENKKIKYCDNHECEFPLCYNKKTIDSTLCDYHKCVNCNGTALRNKYCVDCYRELHHSK